MAEESGMHVRPEQSAGSTDAAVGQDELVRTLRPHFTEQEGLLADEALTDPYSPFNREILQELIGSINPQLRAEATEQILATRGATHSFMTQALDPQKAPSDTTHATVAMLEQRLRSAVSGPPQLSSITDALRLVVRANVPEPTFDHGAYLRAFRTIVLRHLVSQETYVASLAGKNVPTIPRTLRSFLTDIARQKAPDRQAAVLRYEEEILREATFAPAGTLPPDAGAFEERLREMRLKTGGPDPARAMSFEWHMLAELEKAAKAVRDTNDAVMALAPLTETAVQLRALVQTYERLQRELAAQPPPHEGEMLLKARLCDARQRYTLASQELLRIRALIDTARPTVTGHLASYEKLVARYEGVARVARALREYESRRLVISPESRSMIEKREPGTYPDFEAKKQRIRNAHGPDPQWSTGASAEYMLDVLLQEKPLVQPNVGKLSSSPASELDDSKGGADVVLCTEVRDPSCLATGHVVYGALDVTTDSTKYDANLRARLWSPYPQRGTISVRRVIVHLHPDLCAEFLKMHLTNLLINARESASSAYTKASYVLQMRGVPILSEPVTHVADRGKQIPVLTHPAMYEQILLQLRSWGPPEKPLWLTSTASVGTSSLPAKSPTTP